MKMFDPTVAYNNAEVIKNTLRYFHNLNQREKIYYLLGIGKITKFFLPVF